MIASFRKGFYHCIGDVRRVYIGFFAPIVAARRLVLEHSWDYVHQLRVVYRYAFWTRSSK